MTRKELAKAISAKTRLPLAKAENLIVAFGDAIYNALARGDKVVYSNFGTFYKVHYPSKIIYHPKLGKEKQMIMLPTDVMKWMPSANIKDLANSEYEVDETLPLTAHGVRKFTGRLSTAPKFTNIVDQQKETVPQTRKSTEEQEDPSVEIPIHTIKKIPEKTAAVQPINPNLNIYEELMGDGSKVESTFKDAIRVHKDKPSFFGRLFGKNNPALDKTTGTNKTAPTKVSLAGAGLFNKDLNSSLPAAKPIVKPPIDNISKDTPPVIETFRREKEQPLPPTPVAQKMSTMDPFLQAKDKAKVTYVDLSKTIVPKEILSKIPEKLARQYKIAPIEENDNQLVVAMADPEDIETREMIKKIVSKQIVTKLSSEEDINHVLDQYSGLEKELKEAIGAADTIEEAEEKEVTKNEKVDLIETSDNAPAARIVSSLLRRAIRDKASDIHIEPEENDVLIRFRQDGILKKTVSLPKDLRSSVISRIKILSNMKIDEQRLPQDGRFSIKVDDRRVDFRVSSMPVANGEKIVMRVLDKMTGILSVEQLGLRGSGLAVLTENLKKSHGMILVTGPTGSGKTTTLYALIDKLYSEGVNIVTLEDPIEYRMPGINQSQVNAEIDYTFASGLRSIVRQDPDIIMIGEIRDSETAEMAVHAALTGHIVLSTLHTNDAAGAAPRLIDMKVEPFLLTSSLNVVIGQRLARKICEDCKEEIKISDIELKKINDEIQKMPEKEKSSIKDIKFYHGKGCKNCGDTGYKGRVGLFEVLGMTETLKELVLKKESSYKIQELAVKEGMVTMLQDGILKAIDGITTLEEVWRTTKE